MKAVASWLTAVLSIQIVRVGNNEVLLEWYNSPFAGVAPSRYRVFMRNKSRNFSQWKEVYCPGDITKTQFLVRDLPMGVSCQFRVSACNSGGWGALSEETIFVTPGEESEQVSSDTKWRRIKEGGILAALDHMEQFSANSEEQRRGLHMLVSYGQTNMGFKNSAMSTKVAATALADIKTFDRDPVIVALAFNVLGWCLKGKSERKTRQFCLQNGVVELAQTATEQYRCDSSVMNGIAWLRSMMGKYLAVPEEIERHPTLNPQPKVKGEHANNDDDEEDFEYVVDEEEEDA